MSDRVGRLLSAIFWAVFTTRCRAFLSAAEQFPYHTVMQELEVRKMLVLKSSQSNLQQQQTHLVSQDSAMGNITVSDIDLKGSYVRLSNTSNKDQPLEGWEVHIQVNDRKPIVYKFFSSFKLEAGNTVTIWSSDHPGRNDPPTDLVWFSQKSWGTGEELLVTVYNNTGEEMARVLKTPDTTAV